MYWTSFIVSVHISTSSFLNCLDEFYNMALLQLVSKGMVKYTFDFLNFSVINNGYHVHIASPCIFRVEDGKWNFWINGYYWHFILVSSFAAGLLVPRAPSLTKKNLNWALLFYLFASKMSNTKGRLWWVKCLTSLLLRL